MEARVIFRITRIEAIGIARKVVEAMEREAHPEQADLLPFSQSRRYRATQDLIVTVSIEHCDAPARSHDAGKLLA